MLLIVFSWFCLFIIFSCHGEIYIHLYNKLRGKNSDEKYSFFEKYLLGMVSITTLAAIIHYFFPLNIYSFIFILVTALIYCAYSNFLGRAYSQIYHFFTNNKVLSYGFILFAITILLLSIIPTYIYDNGLYHTQNLIWNKTFSIVPGLGNLHGRLAFNSSTLLLYGITTFQFEIFKTYTTVSSLTLLIFAAWCIYQMANNKLIVNCILCLFLWLFTFSFSVQLSSYNTDLLPALLTIFVALNFILSKEKTWSKPLFFICIPLLCITFKVSSIPIIILSIIYFSNYIYRKKYKSVITVSVLGLLLFLPWIGRFIILSGYIMYPFPSIDIFTFDWKIPIESVINENISIIGFSRMPGFNDYKITNLPFTDWIFIWYLMLSAFNSIFYILATVSPILVWCLYKKNIENQRILIMWIISIIGFIFTFQTAPTFRFSYGFVVLSAILPFLYLKDKELFVIKGQFLSTTYIGAILLILLIAIFIIRIFIPPLISTGGISPELYTVVSAGYIESKPIEEWFPERYGDKMKFLISYIILSVGFLFVYRYTKLKDFIYKITTRLTNIQPAMILFIYFLPGSVILIETSIRNIVNLDKKVNKSELLVQALPDPSFDEGKFQESKLTDSITIYRPINGDRCYDCKIPCAPLRRETNKTLYLRGTKIEQGFKQE